MAQAKNTFDQFDGAAKPVPVRQIAPIIGAVSPEEQARKARDEARAEEAASRAAAADARSASADQRAAAEFEGTGGKPTEAQGKISTLLTRIKGGFQDIAAERTNDPEAQSPGLAETVADGIFGEGIVTRKVRGESRRIVADAQRDVLDALLTLGTGAAYNPEQLEGEMLAHFPQYGDSEREIEIKNARLQRLIESAKVQAGPKWDEIEGAIAPFMAKPAGTANGLPAAPVTEEESAALFGGRALFDESGNPIGKDYAGETYYKDGTFGPLRGRVSDETPVEDPRDNMGMLDSLGETITGRERSTPEIEALPDAMNMPVGAGNPLQGLLVALGAVTASPYELARIIVSNSPGTTVRQDAKGNYILKSGIDGKEYAIKPGFRAPDALRAVTGAVAFAPAGRAATAGGAFMGGAATQAGIETAQAATGGTFDPGDVLIAGAANAGGTLIGRGISAATSGGAGRVAQEAVEAAPVPQAPPAAMPLERVAGESLSRPVAQDAVAEFGELARKAVGRGKPARDAKEQLAIAAQANPEAKAAAERLGIELPIDVLADDARLLTAEGLARSQINSDAQNAWGQAVEGAIQRADDTLSQIGATRDLAQVSSDVRLRLESDMGLLEKQGNVLRREVDDAIDVRAGVEANNLQAALGQTINDLGGLSEAKQAFSAEEKKLLAMLGEGEAAKMPTYARLNQVRDQIGRAIYKNEGPWVDAPTATLKKYYGALAQDQLAHIESVGGKELADKMRGSNDLFSKMFGVRDTMQTVFGKSLEKDIGGVITSAVTGASKGDGKSLRTLLGAVPADMQPRVLLSGIMAQTDRAGANGGFSFTKYASLYRGLRQNAPLYKQIADTVGPDAAKVMQDLYAISNRIASAEAKIVRTGASNQPILNALKAETLMARTVDASKRVGARAAAATAGTLVGGPVGGFAGQEMGGALVDALTQGGKSNLNKLHDLLSSDAFRELVEKAATGEAPDRAVNRVVNDPKFRRFSTLVLGLKTPQERKGWIVGALNGSPATGAASTGGGASAASLPLAAEDRSSDVDTKATAPGPQ